MKTAIVSALTFLLVSCAPVAEAVLHVSESFDYNSGLSLTGRGTSGSGWGSGWSGDSQPSIVSPGLTYTDSLGNTLNVSGNAARSGSGSSLKKDERAVSNTNLDNNGVSLWMSFLATGATGSARTNVNLSEKFFVGQGNKTSNATTWTMSDDGQSGFDFNSGVSASGVTAFLVTLIEFGSSGERAWLWINPDLNTTPTKAASATGTAGIAIQNFEFDKVYVYFSGNNSGVIDELRLGSTYGDVAPFTAIPEPSAILFGTLVCGLIGLATVSRRLAGRRGALTSKDDMEATAVALQA